MKYIKRYDTYNDLASAETVTTTEEYVSSIIPGVAGIRENTVPVWYNQDPSNKKMTIEELIAEGYAEIKKDSVRAALAGTERNWNIIQIHPNCPIKLSNITMTILQVQPRLYGERNYLQGGNQVNWLQNIMVLNFTDQSARKCFHALTFPALMNLVFHLPVVVIYMFIQASYHKDMQVAGTIIQI